jgi:hypothetical protein
MEMHTNACLVLMTEKDHPVHDIISDEKIGIE